jgi:plastocyanin
MTYPRAILLLAVVAIGMFTFLPLLAIGGLGDIGDSNGYVPPNASASAAAAGSGTATGSGTASGSGTAAGGTTPAAGSKSVTITATSTAYDKTKITVPAGPVAITFDNKDKGVMHNLHAYAGKDNSGKDIGSTTLKPGPNTQTLNVTLQVGTYYFECDAHPDQMHGTITAT